MKIFKNNKNTKEPKKKSKQHMKIKGAPPKKKMATYEEA
jgi:hypothetical protein